MRGRRGRVGWHGLLLVLASLTLLGCSARRVAVNLIADTLAGGDVFASDDDPELIREAIPFGLKTYESLLQTSPDHVGLRLAAARGFATYAFLLHDEADRIDPTDFLRARQLRARARKLYLRGRDHALEGLAIRHAGFPAALRSDRTSALARADRADAPLLYWGGAAWAGALSAAKEDLGLVAALPIAVALIRRGLELDEGYDRGAAHELLISYEGSRPGGSVDRARAHYRRALELSRGQRASVHLALAEAVSLREQNLDEFTTLLDAALAVNPDEVPELRLANLIAQRRARWLRTRIPDLFVDAEDSEKTP